MKSTKRTKESVVLKKSDCAIRVKFIVKQSHFAQQKVFFRHARMLSITHIDPFFLFFNSIFLLKLSIVTRLFNFKFLLFRSFFI